MADLETPRDSEETPGERRVAVYRPKPTDEVARNMRAIRSKENQSERRLRSELHRMGLRFRKYASDIPGKPDIVFVREKIAVFVDGDYWHARLLRESGEAALEAYLKKAEGKDYWRRKFARRIERDDEISAELHRLGWTVVRLWESEVKKDPYACALQIWELIGSVRAASPSTQTPKSPS